MTVRRSATTVRSSYRAPDTLRSRAGIYRYRRGTTDLKATIGTLLDVRPGERLLDVGCGEGPYFELAAQRRPTLIAGIDASPQMLQRARSAADERSVDPVPVLVQATLDRLPVRPKSWDVVLAAHSLYHADDPVLALRRLFDLLRPGGRLVIVLNADDHLLELRGLARSAGHPGLLGESARLTAEAATSALVDREPHVTWVDDELVLPGPDPVLAYVDSTRRIYEERLTHGITWPMMLDRLEARTVARIRRDGPLRVRTRTAVIRCR